MGRQLYTVQYLWRCIPDPGNDASVPAFAQVYEHHEDLYPQFCDGVVRLCYHPVHLRIRHHQCLSAFDSGIPDYGSHRYAERGDLQSVGWLIQNLSSLSEETAIKFTNLHVIGSLSATHTAVLCSYDWYSVFGLKDTLVMFEDISGTLDASAFTDGAVFSATVFAHNVKVVENVNGQRVVCVQYSTF